MKKSILAGLMCFLALSAVSCTGNSADSDQPTDGAVDTNQGGGSSTTISFFGWGSQEEQKNFQELIDEFMVEEPTIKVTYTAASSDSYMNVLKNKGNNLPDVFYMPDYDFMQWADSGKLLPLDSYVTTEELDSIWELSTDMFRYNRDTFKLGEGDLYALPKDLGPYAVVYNVDLLKSIIEENNLNIDLPDPDKPMTWDQFTEYLKKITVERDGKKIYGIGFYELMAAVYSNNANFFDDAVKSQKITDPNFIEAVQFVADLSLKHKVAPTADEQSSQNAFQRFLNQGCVFTFMGPWDCKQFWNDLPFEFDLIPTPVGPADGAKSTSWVGSVGYCVSAKSKKKEAAIKLAKFLSLSLIIRILL